MFAQWRSPSHAANGGEEEQQQGETRFNYSQGTSISGLYFLSRAQTYRWKVSLHRTESTEGGLEDNAWRLYGDCNFFGAAACPQTDRNFNHQDHPAILRRR